MIKRTTTTILAVALTTACGGAGAEATASQDPQAQQSLVEELENTPLDQALANREHFAPLCDEAGFPLPGNVNSKRGASKVAEFCDAIAPRPSAPPVSAPTTPPAKPTPAPPVCDRDALNRELSNVVLDEALGRRDHFRCLCDDQGYPLVGNINAKGATASAFCAALKAKGQL